MRNKGWPVPVESEPNHPVMKKRNTPRLRKCKIRINLRKFESIRMTFPSYGFEVFLHCLN